MTRKHSKIKHGFGIHYSRKFRMIFRKANPQDIPTILELQKRNLLKNLEPQDQHDGFLSIEYSIDQLECLNRELGIFIAIDNDHLAGYLIAQTIDFALRSPLINTMINRFPDVQHGARRLSELKAFIYGPVCIDKGSRGQGILEGLYGLMLKTLQGQFDIGVAFISERNPRSLYAHRNKLEMKIVDEFEFSGQQYNTLVFEAGAEGTEAP